MRLSYLDWEDLAPLEAINLRQIAGPISPVQLEAEGHDYRELSRNRQMTIAKALVAGS
jgi:hypothetical protein